MQRDIDIEAQARDSRAQGTSCNVLTLSSRLNVHVLFRSQVDGHR